MTFKEKYIQIKLIIRKFIIFFRNLPWLHILVLSICISLSLIVFFVLKYKCFNSFNAENALTNLLTVNGVFSAILITYLFSRITWSKERKLEIYKDAVALSQKITEYRRVLNKLTSYYNVWKNDKSTKSLIHHGEFKTIDFYDYRLSSVSDYKPHNNQLINKLRAHPDFQEGQSTLYLAMVSLVANRNNPNYELQEELYKDFEINGIYNIKVVEKWIDCEIFGTIWYWLDQDYDFMNYIALKNDKDYILSAISRINKRYEGQGLSNKLLKEVTDDFNSHYLKELYFRLKELKKGITDLNLIIIILISISLIFGVLIPFGLLLIQSKTYWFSLLVGIASSINAGLMAYFILRFPTLISKELKWI